MDERFDVIVVGAGPAGLSAAYLLAKAGLKTVVFERGQYPGSKNVMGGILYTKMMDEVIPEFWREAPLERPIIEQNLWVLNRDSAVKVGHRGDRFTEEPHNAYTVFRAEFDRWFGTKVEEAGALLITETLVEDLIWDGQRVTGVKVGRDEGEVFADVVVVAAGVNTLDSLLPNRPQGGRGHRPEQVALAVKEVIQLTEEKVSDRFNLPSGYGASIELVGEATAGLTGTAFIYTNRDSLSVGVGGMLSDFVKANFNPHELIERFKSHPVIQPLLEGGEVKEYLAHLIPEGGYNSMPPLYGDGYVVVGDAGMLVNALHREGSNMAMTSGRLAAETIIEARKKGDFSKRSLKEYRQRLDQTYVIKDLRKYRNASRFFEETPALFHVYPEMAAEAAAILLTVDGVPKREKQGQIWRMMREKRSLWHMLRDLHNARRSLL